MNDKIDGLLQQRGQQWGDAVVTHADIALVWSGILGHEVTAQQVALCMAGLKLVRARVNPEAQDSYDDLHGYGQIAEWIIFEGRDPRQGHMPGCVLEPDHGAGCCRVPEVDEPIDFVPIEFEEVTPDRPLFDVITGGHVQGCTDGDHTGVCSNYRDGR